MGGLAAVLGWLVAAVVPLLACLPIRTVTSRELAWARDRWLWAVGGLGALWLLGREPVLGLAWLAALVHWRSRAQVASVLTWLAICAWWGLVREGLDPIRQWLPMALPVVGTVHAVVCLGQWAAGLEDRGLPGNRTHAAGMLALCLPFTLVQPWAWWGLPVIAAALVTTSSWGAWLGALAGLTILWPWSLLGTAPVVGILLVPILRQARVPAVTVRHGPGHDTWLDRWGRGTSLDSLRARWAACWVLLHDLTWRGRGSRGAHQTLVRRAGPIAGVHCEPLQYAYEYGALGVAAMGALGWRLWPSLSLGEPWTAAIVTGTLLSLGASPFRVAPLGVLWWTLCAAWAR